MHGLAESAIRPVYVQNVGQRSGFQPRFPLQVDGLGDNSYLDRLENTQVPNYLFTGPITSK